MDREIIERDLSSKRKVLLMPLLKYFPSTKGVITLIRNTRGNLKVSNHLVDAKDAFPRWLRLWSSKDMRNFALEGSWFYSTPDYIGFLS